MSKYLTNEWRKNISISRKGKGMGKRTSNGLLGKHLSEAHKRNISIGNKGKEISIEQRKLLSKIRKGKKLSEETKKKMSDSQKRIGNKPPVGMGNKNPNWRGGISFESYSIEWTETLKRAIRERDKYICKMCNDYGNEIHHIDYNKINCNPVNLITLCHSCHSKTNFNRKNWIIYFKNLLCLSH